MDIMLAPFCGGEYSGRRILNGGTCCNVIAALASLGWDSCLLLDGHIGKLQSWRVQALSALGVRASLCGIHQNATPRTITCLRRNDIPLYFTECPKCGRELITNQPLDFRRIKYFVPHPMSIDVFFYDRISPGILSIAKQMQMAERVTFFEPNSSKNKREIISHALESTVFKCSTERIPLSVSNDIRKLVLRNIGQSKLQLIIRTMGDRGAEISFRKNDFMTEWIQLPPLVRKKNVLDPSGAGDCLTASIIDALFPAKEDLSLDRILHAYFGAQSIVQSCCWSYGAQGYLSFHQAGAGKQDLRFLESDKVLCPVCLHGL